LAARRDDKPETVRLKPGEARGARCEYSETGGLMGVGGPVPFVKLDETDYDDALSYALKAPEMNVVLINNLVRFGMEQGNSPFNADYVGNRGPSGLEAVAALYNLGPLFFRADSPASTSGMAECIAGLGRTPVYTAGTRANVEVFLSELGSAVEVAPRVILSEYMVLRGETLKVQPGGTARAAVPEDMDDLVRLQSDFEMEALGNNLVEEDSLRQLLSYQLTEGAAVVVERDGRIVSKAEATVAEPHAALVGGVYTVPEERGRGFSTACIGALCDACLRRVPAVGLNVFVDNHSARRVYFKTGFEVVEEWLTAEMA
jgi:uncharacterized protein